MAGSLPHALRVRGRSVVARDGARHAARDIRQKVQRPQPTPPALQARIFVPQDQIRTGQVGPAGQSVGIRGECRRRRGREGQGRCAIQFQNETHVRLEQYVSCAWRRTNGKDAANAPFSRKPASVFGAPDTDGRRIRTVKPRNAEEFIKLPKEANETRLKITIPPDNAPHHESKGAREFVEDADGPLSRPSRPHAPLNSTPQRRSDAPASGCRAEGALLWRGNRRPPSRRWSPRAGCARP